LNETFTTKSKDVFSDVSMMLFVFDVASEQQEVISNDYKPGIRKDAGFLRGP